jgi:hypothetical protein
MSDKLSIGGTANIRAEAETPASADLLKDESYKHKPCAIYLLQSKPYMEE